MWKQIQKHFELFIQNLIVVPLSLVHAHVEFAGKKALLFEAAKRHRLNELDLSIRPWS